MSPCCGSHDPAECIPAVGDAPGVCCSNCPEDTMRARLIAVLEAKPLFGVAEIVDTALRVLAGHPNDLPARMAAAIREALDQWRALDIDGTRGVRKWDFIAAAAMSVRWEDHAATVAENAELRRRAEHAEGELSALRDHHARWEAEKARADQAEAEVQRLHSWAGLLSLLDEHWPEDIFPTEPDSETRDPGPRIVSLLRWVELLRAGLADSERIRTKLKQTIDAFPDARDAANLAHARSQRDAFKSAIGELLGQREVIGGAIEQARELAAKGGPLGDRITIALALPPMPLPTAVTALTTREESP